MESSTCKEKGSRLMKHKLVGRMPAHQLMEMAKKKTRFQEKQEKKEAEEKLRLQKDEEVDPSLPSGKS